MSKAQPEHGAGDDPNEVIKAEFLCALAEQRALDEAIEGFIENYEGPAAALDGALAELRALVVTEATPKGVADLLTVAEHLAARIATDVRTMREWEQRREGAWRVFDAADREVRAMLDIEAAIVRACDKDTLPVPKVRMLREAAKKLGLPDQEPDEEGLLDEVHQRVFAAMAPCVRIAHGALVNGDELGFALKRAAEVIQNRPHERRRNGQRRRPDVRSEGGDEALIAMAACYVEAASRAKMPGMTVDRADKDVEALFADRLVKPRNDGPMSVKAGTAKTWRSRLRRKIGPAARRRLWEQFVAWSDAPRDGITHAAAPQTWRLSADEKADPELRLRVTVERLSVIKTPSKPPFWLDRRKAGMVRVAPAPGDCDGWKQVMAETASQIRRLLSRPVESE